MDFCVYVSKLSSQHGAYEPFFVTSGFKSVCRFLRSRKTLSQLLRCSHRLQLSDKIMEELYKISTSTIDARACSSDLL